MNLQIELYKTNGAHGLEVETVEEVCDRYTVQDGCLNLYKEKTRAVPSGDGGVTYQYDSIPIKSYSGLAWKSVKVIE